MLYFGFSYDMWQYAPVEESQRKQYFLMTLRRIRFIPKSTHCFGVLRKSISTVFGMASNIQRRKLQHLHESYEDLQ
jgi:hypothetical protein